MNERRAATAIALCVGMLVADATFAQADPPPPPSLTSVIVPRPADLARFVVDERAALALGKALFWDMQVGSDGRTACASCHFHAGADSRARNQVSPGLLQRDALGQQAPDRTFSVPPNTTLRPDHFPVRVLSDPSNRGSVPLRDTNDVVASQGVFHTTFVASSRGDAEEQVLRPPDPDGFAVRALNVRRVTARHTPSVINAVFNHRNFWDGRAQPIFNGVNSWGDRDPAARVYRAVGNHALEAVSVRLEHSSLASQAVAPLLNMNELSAGSRVGGDVGRKLGKKIGKLRPLGGQRVHPDDSVLGAMSRWPQVGLSMSSYEELVRKAFAKEWHHSKATIRVAADGAVTIMERASGASDEYTLGELNFPLFFGIAIQLYEATLVSDDTPYDRWREGRGTLSEQALLGLQLFLGQNERTLSDGTRRAAGRCINCHAGAEFTDASVASIVANGVTRLREGQDLDRGYNNIGVRPAVEDLGVGARDPFGNPLSITRMQAPPLPPRAIAVDGAVKAPGLRNVELTAPYFHNGGYATLEGVVEFYSRGGDFAPLTALDGTLIRPLSVPMFSAAEKAALVEFMKSLTDERVRTRRAPFDHPELFVPDGQWLDAHDAWEDPLRPGQALDRMREIPAVGAAGGLPLPAFLAP